MTERNFSGNNLLAVASAAMAVDQTLGLLHSKHNMSHDPEVETQVHPESDRAIIVAGGMGNDGIALARTLGYGYLSHIGSILGVRYAVTNVDPEPLVKVLDEAIDTFGLEKNTFDVYLGSAAGTIMAEPLRELSTRRKFGKVILDGAPHGVEDIQRPLRNLMEIHFDSVKHSRVLAYLARIASSKVLPPATDKEFDIPLELVEACREAIVNADTITLGVQAATIRRSMPDNFLNNVAEEFVYIHGPGEDPMVDNASAIRGWSRSATPLRAVLDYSRPTNSHAAGGNYPRGIVKVLQGNL